MRIAALIAHTPIAAATAILFLFQMAMLAISMSAGFRKIVLPRDETYMRRTINSDDAAIVEYEKTWGNDDDEKVISAPFSEMRRHHGSVFAHKYERDHDLGSVASQIPVVRKEAQNTACT